MLTPRSKAFWIIFPLTVTAVSVLAVSRLRRHAEPTSPTAASENAAAMASAESPAPAPPPITIPAQTELEVRLDQSLATNRIASGNPFYATLADPVEVDGQTVIPTGAPVTGEVVYAREAGRLKGVAEIRLALTSVEINGSNYHLDSTTVTRFGRNHKKRNWEMIGGGAGVGAALGALFGHGKGALIGAPVGAGAGVAGAAITEKRNLVIPAETPMAFRLLQPVEVTS